METLVIERRIGPAKLSIPGEIASAPFGVEVAKLGRAIQEALVKNVGEALRDFLVDDGFAIPQETHLTRATVS